MIGVGLVMRGRERDGGAGRGTAEPRTEIWSPWL